MHIQECLNPRTIINPYSHEKMVVPCGKCSACLNARASRWVQRLDQERYCWQYALFFTLTYDNQHLPVLTKQKDSPFYADFSSEHFDIAGRGCAPVINIEEHLNSCAWNLDLYNKERSFIDSSDVIPYVSAYDIQRFVKRIRIHLKRKFNSDEKIRFFICTEYGPKHRRPHAHGLFFFNSSQFASALPQLIREDWFYGFTDSSFVSGTNSSYVASYLNCTSHLPQIYKHKFLRPFILCSKMPPIGTLAHSTAQIQKIFYEASPEFIIQNHKNGLFCNVPLWQTYKDSLFPRLTAFDRLSHVDRVALYRSVERISKRLDEEITFPVFMNVVTSSHALPVEKSYIDYFRSFNDDIRNSLYRWYFICCRVLYQSAVFGISVRDYVKKIEEFYCNVEKYRLKKQFEFEDSYSNDYDTSSLIGIDSLYLQSLFDLDIGSLTAQEIITLESFGIDVERFYSADLTERFEYQTSLIPNNTYEFQVFKMDSEIIRNKNTKTKKKNEYIEYQLIDKFEKENELLSQRYADF